MSSDGENGDFEVAAKNQTWFKVENKTEFELEPQDAFGDWGDVASSPSTIPPYESGSGGHFLSSRSPFTGSAGMVGYKIRDGDETLYLRFLGSNPYLSAKDNQSNSAILRENKGTGPGDYNWLYYRNEKDDEKSFSSRTLKVSSLIGQADQATAILQLH